MYMYNVVTLSGRTVDHGCKLNRYIDINTKKNANRKRFKCQNAT